MAKRGNGTKQQTNESATIAAGIEARVVALAEQLGRIAGTVQTRAEGLVDLEALDKQIVATKATNAAVAAKKETVTAARRDTKGRSGGVVDAPGKKHRKPLPAGAGAKVAKSQAAKLRTARPMAKTNRRRGRG